MIKKLVIGKNGPSQKWLWCVLLSMTMGISSLWAFEITMEIDRTELTLEDQAELRVSVAGESQISEEPVLKQVKGLTIQSSGASSEISIINGVTSMRKVYHYMVIPENDGTFTLGPATVEVEGTRYQSNKLVVKVGQAAPATPTSAPGQAKPQQEGILPASEVNEQADRPYFIQTDVDEKSPFVNQQIVFTFRFYTSVPVTNANLDYPDFNGLVKEELQGQKEFQTMINGVSWQVTEIKTALFPTKEGKITINPAELVAAVLTRSNRPTRSLFDSFFENAQQIRQVRLKSKPIVLDVRPLPQQGRPADFSGLVGNFQMEGKLSKASVQVGDSVTLTLAIKGTGNIRDATFPEINWDGFKAYDDKPELKITKGTKGLEGIKTLKKALVPLKEQNAELPPISLTYFDPVERIYKVTQTEKLTLSVSPGAKEDLEKLNHTTAGGASETNLKKDIQVVGEDLMPIIRDSRVVTNSQLSTGEATVLFGLIFLFPFTQLGLVLYQRRQGKLKNDHGLMLRENAFKNFLKETHKLPSDSNFYGQAAHLLRIYLSDRLNMDAKGLTPLDAARRLSPFGIEHRLIEETSSFLKECELKQFGGAAVKGKGEKEKIKDRLLTLVKNLEKGQKI